ncbi:MAG TPA: hypothetical protein VGL61_06555 [Kofleriaceae bacterium]
MTVERVEEIVEASVPAGEPCSCCGEPAEVFVPVGEAALACCWPCSERIVHVVDASPAN